MLKTLKSVMAAVALAAVLAACAVPAAIEPQRDAAIGMPARADGVTVVTGHVPGFDAGAGTIGVSFDVRNNEVNYASGTIDDAGNFTLLLQEPPRNALYPVRDAWLANVDITTSNPQARLAFIYYYAVYHDRERPSGWIFMDTDLDPDDDIKEGDMYAAYVYASEPTRIRINDTGPGGFRYVSDLNLARGWNRVLTEIASVTAGVITQRESVSYDRPVLWQYEAAD